MEFFIGGRAFTRPTNNYRRNNNSDNSGDYRRENNKNYERKNNKDFRTNYHRNNYEQRRKFLDKDYENFQNFRKQMFLNSQRKGLFNKIFKTGRLYCRLCGKPLNRHHY
jgi:hypothetical protein